jgi:hypothetical protein
VIPRNGEYAARITRTLVNGAPQVSNIVAPVETVTYDAVSERFEPERIVVVDAEPANRRPFNTGTNVVAALPGDPCWIRVIDDRRELIVIEGAFAEQCVDE